MKTLTKKTKQGLVFWDPLYYAKGKKLYTNFYEHGDHELVAKALADSPHKHWIVTYDNVAEINDIYYLTNKIVYDLKYSLHHKSTSGSEPLFFSDAVSLPYHPNFPKN